ncbi:MAG: aromatic ring-hydroxylating dioxygenase subunit alpha [Ilumatobacter sp.]|nr:aromatic ring-hydroxylating dioxygenase subunit alpha [Ilumatobacter sp.]
MTKFVHSESLRSAWHPVAESVDVTIHPVEVALLGERFVAWRDVDGAVVVAPNQCPHRQAPLAAGTVADGVLTCPYHGWSFGAGGRCVRVPSSGEDATIPPAAHLRAAHVEERYGLVWVCLGDEPGSLPVIAHEDDPTFRRINSGMQHWDVSAPRMVDNFCDISHFPWVHVGTFGRSQSPTVPRIELGDLGDGWYGYEYEVDADNPDEATATTGTDDAVVHRRMSTGFHLPLTVRSTIEYESGLHHVLLLCSTPVDDERSLFTFVVWRNDDHDTNPEEAIAFDRAIGAEDQRMLEQLEGTMPLGRTELASVQADRCSVEWRRRFAAMVLGESRSPDRSDADRSGDGPH